jgi:hypothetical protein
MRKYHGLQEAINEMPTHDRHNGLYVEVCYDLDSDEVLTEVYVDFGEGNRTIYDNPRIVRIGNFVRRVSAAKLKEYIDEVADFYI